MKKTILALLLVGSGAAALAQNTQSDSTMNGSNNSTNSSLNSNTNTSGDTNTNSSMNATNNSTNNSSNNNSWNSNTNSNMNSNNSTMNASSDSSAPMNSSSSLSSTGSYNAYSAATNVPNTIQTSFQQAYPGATGTRWEQSNDFYRVYYQNNGQDMNMYYDARGNSFMMALPVAVAGVGTDVISKIKGMYGTNVYDVTPIKVADHSDAYHVRIIENGQIRSEVIDAQGQPISQIWRTPESDSIWEASQRAQAAMAADSMNYNSNMSTEQGATIDSSSSNMNSNNVNSSATSTDSTMSSNSTNSNMNSSSSNNSNTQNVQTDDHNATKTEETKMQSDSTIKKDE